MLAPPPALVSALTELRGFFLDQQTRPPKQLARDLFAMPATLRNICRHLDGAITNLTSQPHLVAVYHHLVTDGTITSVVPAVLRRLHSPGHVSGARSSPEEAFRTMKAGGFLAAIISPWVCAALKRLTSPEAQAAGSAFMQALALSGITNVLSQAMATAIAASVASAGGNASVVAEQLTPLASLGYLSMVVLQHTLRSESVSAALRSDVAASHLLRTTCDFMTRLLGTPAEPQSSLVGPVVVVRVTQQLACGFLNCAIAAPAAAVSSVAVAEDSGCGARCAALRAFLEEPAFARLIAQALSHFRPAPRLPAHAVPGCTAADQVALLHALNVWLAQAHRRDGGDGPARLVSTGLTAQRVGAMALASADCCTEATASAVQRMYLLLQPSERVHAYAGVAAHSAQLLDRLVVWLRGGGTDVVSGKGGLAAVPTACMYTEQCIGGAVELFATPYLGDGRQHLLQCARRVMHFDLLEKAEALVRAAFAPPTAGAGAPGGSSQQPPNRAAARTHAAHAAFFACQCAAGVAVALSGDSEEGRGALAAFHSLLATSRKVVEIRAQELAPHSYPTANSSTTSSTTSSINGEACEDGLPLIFRPCLALRAVLSPAHLEASQAETGTAASTAVLAVRTCALQLLPGLMQGLLASADPPPASPASSVSNDRVLDGLVRTLPLLSRLHPAGLGGVALAVGVPGLLVQLVTPQRERKDATSGLYSPHNSLVFQDAAMSAVASAARCSAWLREAVRLGLRETLLCTVEAEPDFLALVRYSPEAAVVVRRMLGNAKALVSKCQALPAADASEAACPVPSWDSCAIDTAAQASAAGCVPFLGCWNLRCTNLAGDSEAALKLFLCSSCRLARYCSEACQKQAWAGGHRAACTAWKARQAAMPSASAV